MTIMILLFILTVFVAAMIKAVDGVPITLWTEDDEARRIQQLIEAEEMEYEIEQRLQSNTGTDGSSVSNTDLYQRNYHHYPFTERYRYKHTTILPITSTSTVAFITTRDDSFWCYHCASPLNTVSGNMRRAIEKFLLLRRTNYPLQVKNIHCSEPRNLTELVVERCLHPYCQTLVLTDHDTGSAFTMRGCAETFGAINEELLDARGDNTCQR